MPLSKLFPCFQFKLEDNINKLDYSNNILSEGFPQVWQYERTLEELNVTSTRINYLPPQLFYCQSLKILIANNNNLESIPEALGSLRQLQQLHLSRNFILHVPDNIKSCKSLTHLDLSSNTLQKLPDALTCLISLQELILNETYLEFLPANFGRLVNLRIVELRSNNLISLPKSMHRLSNLQRLDIGYNEFTKMPEVIGELKQLRELWFDFNQIQSLPQQFGKLRELLHCEANGNCLNYLPTEIENWRNLEVLSISINSIKKLPFNFGALKTLVTLKCESNELTELPSSISNLENLEELVISHNNLVELPNTIGMLRKLRYLFADDNNLQKLPDEICSCSELSILSVSRNQISSLPDNIGHLTLLKVLNIVHNNISSLPVTVLSLVNLTSLWISNNQSQPLIPLQYTDIAQKTQLTCFMLPQFTSEQKYSHLNNVSDNVVPFDECLEEAAGCTLAKRRICFAEEATILHTETESRNLSFPTSMSKLCIKDKYDPLYNAFTTRSFSCKEPTSENVNIFPLNQDFLMRSPTPYPKELRLMAKYVKINQEKLLNKNNTIVCEENNFEYPCTSKPQNKNFEDEVDSCNYNTYDEPELKNTTKCNGLNIQNGDNIHLNSLLKQDGSQSQENEELIQKHTEILTNPYQEFYVADHSPKPPPYHIARYFTKKSAEDFTKYEFMRKKQDQQHHSQNCKANVDNEQLYTDIASKKFGASITDKHKCDYQNNIMNNRYQLENEPKKDIEGNEVSSTSLTLNLNSDVGHGDYLETSNEKINKSKTKWLFGVHRNPRVLQINLSWENGRDFEINVLPNKEGIFVVSTPSDSETSNLIHPFDKLLEVNGVDFSNISLAEALQVLDKSRSSISIMLSRNNS